METQEKFRTQMSKEMTWFTFISFCYFFSELKFSRIPVFIILLFRLLDILMSTHCHNNIRTSITKIILMWNFIFISCIFFGPSVHFSLFFVALNLRVIILITDVEIVLLFFLINLSSFFIFTCIPTIRGIVIFPLDHLEVLEFNNLLSYVFFIQISFESICLYFFSEYEKGRLFSLSKVFEERKKMQRSFIMKLSHELKTSLNGIIPFTQKLQQIYEEEFQEEKSVIENSFEVVFQCAKDIKCLVDDLIDYQELKCKEVILRKKKCDPVRIIKSCIKVQKTLILQKKEDKVKLIVNIEKSIPSTVVIDPNRFVQILNNLISNSFKYTDEGIIRIFAFYTESLNLITFKIADEGCGISKENIKNLFVPFSKEKNAGVKGNGKSSFGLGLVIAKDLAKLMDGNIEIKSKGEGFGTTATFYFKIESSFSRNRSWGNVKTRRLSTSLVKENDNQINLKLRKGRKNSFGISSVHHKSFAKKYPFKILIVEDNIVNLKVLNFILTNLGYGINNVDFAMNGKEAIEKKKKRKYNVCFMDINMPVMSGDVATKEIRKTNNLIRIYAVTATCRWTKIDLFEKIGFNGIIEKPINLEKIRAALVESKGALKKVVGNSPMKRKALRRSYSVSSSINKFNNRMRKTSLESLERMFVFQNRKKHYVSRVLFILTCLSMFLYFIVFFPSYYVLYFIPNIFFSYLLLNYTHKTFSLKVTNYVFFFFQLFFQILCFGNTDKFIELFVCSAIVKSITLLDEPGLMIILNLFCVGILKITNVMSFVGLFHMFIKEKNDIEFSYLVLFDVIIVVCDIFVFFKQREQKKKKIMTIVNKLKRIYLIQYKFIGKISHDLRNPIHGMNSFLTNLQEMDCVREYKDVKIVNELFRDVFRCIAQVEELVCNCLDYYRIANNLITPCFVLVNVQEFFKKMFRRHSHLRTKNEIPFITRVENISKLLKIDLRVTGRIVSNILYNSLERTSVGHVKVIVAHRKTTLLMVVRETVQSNDDNKHVDDEKVNSFNFLSSRYLRMFVAKQLSKLLNGTLIVKNDNESGEVVTILKIPAKSPPQKRNLKGKRIIEKSNFAKYYPLSILVVDDSVCLLKVLCNMLETRLGYKGVVCALNGKEGIEKFKEKHYDVVFTDIKMPIINGFEMVKMMIKHGMLRRTEVCFVSAADWSTLELTKKMGRNVFMCRKPYKIENIMEVLEKIHNKNLCRST